MGRRSASSSLNPIEPPAEGGGRFVLAIIRDITERRRGEEALRDAEALFRSVFDNASIGMAVTAPDARLLRVNPAMCEILGYSEDELLGTEFSDITHPEDLDVSTGYFHQAIEGEIDEYSLEKRYVGAGDRVV
jgi:PAS domain S-box-containing protein